MSTCPDCGCKHGCLCGADEIAAKLVSEPAPASGSETYTSLLLRCPDCQGDKWQKGDDFETYLCLVCWVIYKRHTLYSTPYLRGYERGKREIENS